MLWEEYVQKMGFSYTFFRFASVLGSEHVSIRKFTRSNAFLTLDSNVTFSVLRLKVVGSLKMDDFECLMSAQTRSKTKISLDLISQEELEKKLKYDDEVVGGAQLAYFNNYLRWNIIRY